MKALQLYIFKKVVLCMCCILAAIHPASVFAQAQDEVVVHADSLGSDADDSEEVNREVSSETVFRRVPDTTVERMKKEKAFAYANDPAYWVKHKRTYRKDFWDYAFDFFTSSAVRVIFYASMIGLAIFVLYRIIVVNDLFAFKASKKSQQLFEKEGTEEASRETVDSKIQEAIDEKNFHAAVRYLFLKTLYLLNDKNVIQFHPEATNSQYLHQMNAHKHNKDFRFLTRVYEYICYGRVQITEEQFSLVHTSFKNFHAAL